MDDDNAIGLMAIVRSGFLLPTSDNLLFCFCFLFLVCFVWNFAKDRLQYYTAYQLRLRDPRVTEEAIKQSDECNKLRFE